MLNDSSFSVFCLYTFPTLLCSWGSTTLGFHEHCPKVCRTSSKTFVYSDIKFHCIPHIFQHRANNLGIFVSWVALWSPLLINWLISICWLCYILLLHEKTHRKLDRLSCHSFSILLNQGTSQLWSILNNPFLSFLCIQ